MRLLLDTAVLLWVTYDAPRLSPAARAAYLAPESELFVSAVSLWEIIVKHRLKKLPLPEPIEEMLKPLKRSRSMQILPLTESAVPKLSGLPDTHRDPFDRMLVCQAIDENMTLVTPDPVIRAYPAMTLW